MNNCLICKENQKNNFESIILTNKEFVHKSCEQNLYKSIINTKNIELKNLQRSIYDYWPSYPPDWSERKKRIKEVRKVCSKCGKTKTRKYRKYPLEFHHIIPIRLCGNHLDSNLELICKSCHKKEHEKNPFKFRKKARTQHLFSPH